MSRICTLFFLILILISSCTQEDKDTLLSFNDVRINDIDMFEGKDGWYNIQGNTYIDTLEPYKEEKSVRLTPLTNDSTKKAEILYFIQNDELDGEIISFSGKYKYKEAEDVTITFLIYQLVNNDLKKDSIQITNSKGDKNWIDFNVQTTLSKETKSITFSSSISGNASLWISNCRVEIDEQPLGNLVNVKYGAEDDKEFDKSSDISLDTLTPQMTENLEVLGKVWGFLKYYHPEVTQGKYNWDYELFRVLPQIANAKDKNERNGLLNKWIDKYGEITETTDYTITDSTKYSRIINLDWLTDRNVFDEQLINKLQKIKSAKRSDRLNYYVLPYQSSGRKKDFYRERPYKNIRWEDQGFRILTLFRLWNIVQYCFPYTNYTDTNWNTLLKKFIPTYVVPKDKVSYELSILKLFAHIDDSHGFVINFPNNSLAKTIIAPTLIYQKYKTPVELIHSSDGYIVVKSTESSDLKRGDILLAVNEKPVFDIIEEMRPYIAASNRNGSIRNVMHHLLSSNKPQLKVKILRNGKEKTMDIHMNSSTRKKESIKSWEDYNLYEKGIIHVDNIKSAEENKKIVESNLNSKGLIIDMRKYPDKNNQILLSSILRSKYALWISVNNKSFPGNFSYKEQGSFEKVNSQYYQGKIVILVDENTQSAGESWAMNYQLIPNSVTIGSQTAGANGNISAPIPLPSNIKLQYSALGAYYPHGEVLQRKGIKIDIYVKPTVQDIKEGRDVWVEKAIDYILQN